MADRELPKVGAKIHYDPGDGQPNIRRMRATERAACDIERELGAIDVTVHVMTNGFIIVVADSSITADKLSGWEHGV